MTSSKWPRFYWFNTKLDLYFHNFNNFANVTAEFTNKTQTHHRSAGELVSEMQVPNFCADTCSPIWRWLIDWLMAAQSTWHVSLWIRIYQTLIIYGQNGCNWYEHNVQRYKDVHCILHYTLLFFVIHYFHIISFALIIWYIENMHILTGFG